LPYWQEAQAGLTDIGKTAGVKVEMEGPATLSPSEELSVFQKVVAQIPPASWFGQRPRVIQGVHQQSCVAGNPGDLHGFGLARFTPCAFHRDG